MTFYKTFSCNNSTTATEKKTNNGQKGYSFRGAKSWNGFSAGAKGVPSLASFKSYL